MGEEKNMMIASLRDAEIYINKLLTQVDSLDRSINVVNVASTQLKKAFEANLTSTGGKEFTKNVLPLPPDIPVAIYDSSTSLANLPTGLTTASQGQEYYNSYFGRWWFWDGANWHYKDSGVGAGGQVTTSDSAIPPSGGLWQACDGSTVSCA